MENNTTGMIDEETKKKLDEIGFKVARVLKGQCGSITFDFVKGELKGLRMDVKWRPKK